MESNLVKFPRGWIRVGADSILQPTRVLAPACNLQLSQVPAAGFKLRLSRAPAAGCKSRLTPSYSWIEFRQLDTTCSCLKFWRLDASYGWLHPTADSSSDSCIRVAADSIQRLDTSYSWLCPTADSSSGGLIRLTAELSCGWLQVVTDSILRLTRVPVAGLEMRLTYTLIYQVNLRTCSAKYIFFFFFCFLLPDFSYHWFTLWLLLQGSWSSLKKLKKVWRSFKDLAATDSSCSGWLEPRQLLRDLWLYDYLQIFDPNTPWLPDI